MIFSDLYWINVDAVNSGKRKIVNRGGSSSGKTIAVMQLLRFIAENKPNQYILLVARSVPKLKTTLLKDFKNIIMGPDYDRKSYNKEDKEYLFPSGSIFKFANAYDEDTYKGVRSDYALLDECNTYRKGKEVYDQIEIRLRRCIFLTFNPSEEFWVTFEVVPDKDAIDIHSTYEDNKCEGVYLVEKSIRATLESRAKKDENFYRVYVKGQYGVAEGLVFKFKINWETYEEDPEDYDSVYYGGDFGFTNSKTAAVKLLVDHTTKTIYAKELLYQTGLLNSQIAKILKPVIGGSHIIFDSAEGKSIVSLRNEHGLNAIGAIKGPESVKAGLNRMKEWHILIHKESKNLLNEFFKYRYIDKEGLTNQVLKKNDHLIDAMRYVFLKYRL